MPRYELRIRKLQRGYEATVTLMQIGDDDQGKVIERYCDNKSPALDWLRKQHEVVLDTKPPRIIDIQLPWSKNKPFLTWPER